MCMALLAYPLSLSALDMRSDIMSILHVNDDAALHLYYFPLGTTSDPDADSLILPMYLAARHVLIHLQPPKAYWTANRPSAEW